MTMENEYIYSEEFQNYGDKLKNVLSEYVTLESAIFDVNMGAGEGESEPLKCMQEFLDASLVGDKDTAIKKLFSAGLTLANDSGVLPFELPDSSPESIACIVDNSLIQAKVAYKTATGEISVEEGIDAMVDNAAARTMAIADALVDSVEDNIDAFCNAICMIYPRAAWAIQLSKPIIKYLVTRVSPEVKVVVFAGIEKLSKASKEVAKVTVAKTHEIRAKVKNRQLNAIGQNIVL